METLLTQSRGLLAAGWEFVALRNHNRVDEHPGTVRGAYLLEAPVDTEIDAPESVSETAQAELCEADEVVVTFDPNVVEEFPSIRLLLPGDPLFDSLVSMTRKGSPWEVVFICGKRGANGTADVRTETE